MSFNKSSLKAGLLATVSALALGCGSGLHPVPVQPVVTASIDCGTLTDNSFADFLPEEKAMIIAENNAAITGGATECVFSPTAKFVADPFDPSLPIGTYIWYNGAENINSHGYPYSYNKNGIMQSVKTADTSLAGNYFYFNIRGFFAANGVRTTQAAESMYYYDPSNASLDDPSNPLYGLFPNYSWDHEPTPGTMQDNQLLQKTGLVTKIPFWNGGEDFYEGIDYIYPGYYTSNSPLTNDQTIAGLTALIKPINPAFGIGQNWDPTSFASTTDLLSNQIGKRFLVKIDPVDQVIAVFIRSDNSMNDKSGNFEGIGQYFYGAAVLPNGFLANQFYPVTTQYNGTPQWGTAGTQAQDWANTLAVSINNSSNTVDISPCQPCTNISTPLTRTSANANAIQFNQQLRLPAPRQIKGLLPAQASPAFVAVPQ